MILADLVFWWYSNGFKSFIEKLFDKLKSTADFFSILDLLRTLFSPFRQISAEATSNLALDVRFHAFLDRLFSRFFGAFIRIFIIFFGLIVLVAQSILSFILILFYPLLPFAPLACLVLYFNGVIF